MEVLVFTLTLLLERGAVRFSLDPHSSAILSATFWSRRLPGTPPPTKEGARSITNSNPSATSGPRCLLLAPRKEATSRTQTKYGTRPKSKGCLRAG